MIDFKINSESSSEDWKFIYEEVQDEAQFLVKELSNHVDIPIPIVGLELDNAGGVEAELVWHEFKIAVVIEESIMIEEWTIFNINEEEKLIETLQKRINS